MDQLLRQVFVTLASPGAAAFLANGNSSTGRLVDDIRLMIRKSDLDDEFKQAAESALDAVKAASTTRNRIVHDMWLRDVDAAGGAATHDVSWSRFRLVNGALRSPVADTSQLGELDAGLVQMQRAHVRIHGLYFGLWDELPFFEGSRVASGGQAPLDHIAIMRGEFVLNEDGSFSPN